MAFSDEQLIIKQYHKLIRALIPYQQANKLLEGLNKFSSRLPSRVRHVIKEEVIRLTSLTDAPADNSEFAQFPVMKFKHFGIQMRLDKVGKDILERETVVYQDRYTVGVFESITSSDSYQSHVKQQQYLKTVEAFTIQTQTMSDIDFGDDLALCPNFPVACQDFEKGKNCQLAALSANSMTVETNRPPVTRESGGTTYIFTFPEVNGFCGKGTQISFELSTTRFNKSTNKHETRFTLSPENDPKLLIRLEEYLKNAMTQQPLQRELELERAMQDLERDRVLANSPWIPILLKQDKKQLVPALALLTPANVEANPDFNANVDLPNKGIVKKVIIELLDKSETFLISGRISTPHGPIEIAATHNELIKHDLLGQFVTMIMESGEFTVLHLRLKRLSEKERETAFGTHDILQTDYPDLDNLTHIMYCRDVSQWVGQLKELSSKPFKVFPKSFINEGQRWHVDKLMEEKIDRRAETRYRLEKSATVKTGLLKGYEATLLDISTSGMQLQIKDKKFTEAESVKVNVPELKIKGEKYDLVSYQAESGVLRLKIHKTQSKTVELIQNVVSRNIKFFKVRDIASQQRNIHRFVWELAMRHVPSVSILVTQNRFTIDRLRGLYGCEDSIDLEPFAEFEHQASVHGFFADKGAEKPRSSLLENMFGNSQQEAHIIHCVRKLDRRTIFVEEEEFLFGKLRQQISNNVSDNKIDVYVTQINCRRSDAETCLTAKRLAQLSKIDKDNYEKLKSTQKLYTHVLYLTNISSFHNALLAVGIVPVEKPQAA